MLGFCFLFLSWLLWWFWIETKSSQIFIKLSSCIRELDRILSFLIVLTFSLVLLCLHNSEFFLLDPFSIHFTLLRRTFLLKSTRNIDTFVLVILLKSECFRFLRLWFLLNLFLRFLLILISNRSIFLLSLLDILVFVQVILHISNISFTSTSFSWLISKLITCYTLPVPDLLSW